MEYHIQTLSPEILAEQKAYKASKDSFRAAIKTLSDEQSLLKNQRCTKRRDYALPTVEVPFPYSAASFHWMNREKLRHLYIAYAIFRGKPIPEQDYRFDLNHKVFHLTTALIVQNSVKPNHKLVEKYLAEHVRKAVHPYQS